MRCKADLTVFPSLHRGAQATCSFPSRPLVLDDEGRKNVCLGSRLLNPGCDITINLKYILLCGSWWNALKRDRVVLVTRMVKLHYFRNQRYDKLKSLCVKEKKLFEDPEFPPEDKSLFFSRSPTEAVEWKRPKVCLNVLLQNMFSSIVNRPLYQPFPGTNQLDVSLFVRLLSMWA